MSQRLLATLVMILVRATVISADPLTAQTLSPLELAGVEEWFRSTSSRTGDGQWGIAIGTMDGRVLWSADPHRELIPASTVKVFTIGFPRATAGGGARIATRVIGRG